MLVESFSGIRGLYNQEFIEAAKKYAKAYADWLGKGKIIIGIDGRPSGEEIFKTVTRIFCKEGLEVIYAGIAPTPAIQHAVRKFKLVGGLIISGSHNEPEYNGLKFLQNNGAILNPEDVDILIKNSKSVNFEEGELKFENKNNEVIESYTNFILEKEDVSKTKIKVLVDPNGLAAVLVLKKLKEILGNNLILVNEEIGMINRLVEPNHESMQYLVELLKEKDIDMAFGFDGDADRVEIILKDGTMVDGNYVLGLVMDYVLSTQELGKTIVINDVTSNLIYHLAKPYHAKIEEVEVGEINVVNKMVETKSILGGEGSNGGVIVPPNRCRDGILTMLQIMNFCKKKNSSIKKIIDSYPKYFSHRTIKVCTPNQVPKLNKALQEYFSKKGITIQTRGDETGSVKAYYQDSFLWFRTSKTEFGQYRIITDAPNIEKSKELLVEGARIFDNLVKNL
ncbi:MAG: hypothetical protein ABIC91_00960 [Nanoarchaeota archaeon]|nr:hypothetical protein [Nanoarchaeota archaeon]MBU1030935.1 hypothetical protein [Nanoarchaeota archaeon]MBU1849225.1 hypothetical protein [Nanoarchaeota archaeon]